MLGRRASSQRALVERFERAKAEGDLPGHVDAKLIADVAAWIKEH